MKNFVFFLLIIFNFNIVYTQKIYSTSQSYKADLKVFKVSHPYEAKSNSGLWYFSNQPYNSDKKIFLCDYDYQADLKIYFVKYKYQAKWSGSEKKYLLY